MNTDCLLCGAPGTESYYTNEKNSYHKDFRICRVCGYVFAFPRIAESEYLSYYGGDYAKDTYALKEDDASTTEAIAWRTKSSKMKIDFFNDFYPRGGKVLEIGSGLGTFLKELKDRYGAEVFGIEISPQFVEISSKHFGIPTYGGDVRDFFREHPDEKYDVIVMDQVLEHMYDPVTALTEVKTHLASTGFVYVGTPNIASPAHDKNEFFIPEHVSYFTPYTITRVAERAHLRVASSVVTPFGSMHFLLTHEDAPSIGPEKREQFSPLDREAIDAAFSARATNVRP